MNLARFVILNDRSATKGVEGPAFVLRTAARLRHES